ncbi:MAG: NAD(+)/NADH kinase [Lachnospiraceae bacterium]|nr:NAD(+)/NADH kinase [Lachnospiraceae bacterium]
MKRFLVYARSNVKREILDSIVNTVKNYGGSAELSIVNDTEEEIDDKIDGIDAVISVGGDGTLVSAAKAAKVLHVPIVGINLGHMGYLCDLDIDNMEDGIKSLINDDFEVEERMMLSGYLGGEKRLRRALNDVVISKGPGLNVINLSVYIDGKFLYSYNCDGIIFSTPTGSTGYNLSANGPIVDPTTQVILLNPINPHTLNSRPIVLDKDVDVSVVLNTRHDFEKEEAYVSFDGEKRVLLKKGDELLVHRSEHTTKMIRFSKLNFLERISEKFKED